MSDLKVREDGYLQMVDCEGVELNSGEIFKFKCCDCGLVHDMVVVTQDGEPFGFAVKQDLESSDKHRLQELGK